MHDESQPDRRDADLDKPIYGAAAIADVLNLVDEDGKPNERAAYYAAEKGYIDVDHMGRKLTSTKRRLLKRHLVP